VTVSKQALRPIKIVRCPAGKVKRTRKHHGRAVTVCIARKHKKSVVIHRRIEPPRFTG
jgi:hypothetical protein